MQKLNVARKKLTSTVKRLPVTGQKPCLDLAGLNQTSKVFSDCRSLEDCRMNIEVLKHCSAMLFLVSIREIHRASERRRGGVYIHSLSRGLCFITLLTGSRWV